jgi:hypothetical protein
VGRSLWHLVRVLRYQSGTECDSDHRGNNSCIGGGGTVFKLTPNADGSWTENILHDFANRPSTNPFAGVIFDGAGNLYGTTVSGGPGGTVFRMKPNSDGSWKYSLLHVFMGKPALNPVSSPVLDKAGNLYGTTAGCGSGYKCKGVVFEITP